MNPTLTEMIGHIVDYDRAGRRVAAGLGLTRLRQHYECLDPKDLPLDEQDWEAFAIKHLPLPQMRVAELIGTVVHHGGLLRCTKCGTKSKCECGCGAPYVGEHHWAMPIEKVDDLVKAEPGKEPSALDRAAAAIAAHPEKFDRAIAAEIGVSNQTVKRARQRIEDSESNVTPDVTPEFPTRQTGRPGWPKLSGLQAEKQSRKPQGRLKMAISKKRKSKKVAKARHPFLYRLENGDGTSKIRKAWATVEYTRVPVDLC